MDETSNTATFGEQLGMMLSGYVNRRLDGEFGNRLAVIGQDLQRASTQSPIISSPDTGITVGTGGLRIGSGALLLAAGAALLYIAMRKG